MNRIAKCCAALVLATVAGPAAADAPLPPPATLEVCSPRRVFCGVSEPKTRQTTVYRMNGTARGEAVWSMPGWFRVFHPADDGEHLVIGFDGTLLPVDYDLDAAVLRFYRKGTLIRSVAFREVVSPAQLTRTASHYAWGRYRGFNERGEYELELLDGRVVRFDVTTGRPIR